MPDETSVAKRRDANGQAPAITDLLDAWGHGDVVARDDLLLRVYQELRRRAGAYLRRERVGHTLQPTALVHEAYLRLVGQERMKWQNRAQFFAIASQMMRRILVDHARAHLAAKRPPPALRISIHEGIAATDPFDCEVLLLDEALKELAILDARQGQIVELRYFSGLSEAEVADVLGVSRSTVTREWQTARAWLYRRITGGSGRRSAS
jgi:RNA polymerase sigma factor (TIGR02999 family)